MSESSQAPTPAAPAAATMPLKRRLTRRAWRLLKSLLVNYLLVCLVMYMLQTKLIFQGASTQGTKDAQVDPPPDCELLHLKAADGVPVVALFGKARLASGAADPRAAHLPTVLFFYGNGMCLADTLAEFDMFRRLGANCCAVEYEGYGMSGGTPSEQGCYAAAESAYQHLLTRTDIDTRKLICAGWSLGGGVAIDLANQHRTDQRIVGLITFSSFTSMVAVAQYHYPMFPVALFLKHRFASEEKLPNLKLPYFLGHGRRDSIVPFAHADRLAAVALEAGASLTRYTNPAADHNDFFEVSEKEHEPLLQKFLQQF